MRLSSSRTLSRSWRGTGNEDLELFPAMREEAVPLNRHWSCPMDREDDDAPEDVDRSPGSGKIWLRGMVLVLGGAIGSSLAWMVSGHSWRHFSGGPHAVGLDQLGDHCGIAAQGTRCYGIVRWAMSEGIHLHPDYYPGLTPQSSFAEFQASVYLHSPRHECQQPPCARDFGVSAAQVQAIPRATVAALGTGAAPAVPAAPAAFPAQAQALVAPPPPAAATPAVVEPPKPAVAPLTPRFRFNMAPPAEAPPGTFYRWNISCSAPLIPVPASVVRGKSPESLMMCDCPPPQVFDNSGPEPVCRQPTGMSKMTFYVYRAQSDDNYPPENVNAADLAGVMAYLHNEVIGAVPRKFGITRILRYKITMQNTQAFYDAFQKQFGPFVAFDAGQCTAPGCAAVFAQYGYNIGCQNLDRYLVNTVRDYGFEPPSRRLQDGQLSPITGWGAGQGPSIPRGIPVVDDSFTPGGTTLVPESVVPMARTPTAAAAGPATAPVGGLPGLPVAPIPVPPVTPVAGPTSTSSTTTQSTTTTTWTMTMREQIHDNYHSGIWYSLPGACPEAAVSQKTPQCIANMPGGRCKEVNGGRFCTYDMQPAGEITLDELSGILDPKRGINSYEDWWKKPYDECQKQVAKGLRAPPCTLHMEYNWKTDRGVGCDFWDGKHDLDKSIRRMNRVRELFMLKYPDMPADLGEPDCS
mmetsp:Transcript_84101/g.243093  ORF Transcript_84101/g.243093 Transcript_84101/m.243093 type:complete len:690 (+) Transcript_84101:84-2153(+)